MREKSSKGQRIHFTTIYIACMYERKKKVYLKPRAKKIYNITKEVHTYTEIIPRSFVQFFFSSAPAQRCKTHSVHLNKLYKFTAYITCSYA